MKMVSSYVSKNYNKALRNRGKNMWVNIRNHKLNSLAQEKEQMEAQYRQSKQICPDFYLELLAHME